MATGYAQTLEEWTETSDTAATLTTYTLGDDIIAQGKSHWTRMGEVWAINETNGIDATQYLLYDGHGSTRQLVEVPWDDVLYQSDPAEVVAAYAYDAYGMMLGGNPTATTPADTNLLYTGEHYDTDASQYYLRARWYDPSNGRFNRTDPYAGNNQDPQSLHKYLYCHANPVNGADPSGMFTYMGMLSVCTIIMIVCNIISPIIPIATGMILASIKGVGPGEYLQELGKPLPWLVAFATLGIGYVLGTLITKVAERWAERWFPIIGAALSIFSLGQSMWMSFKMIEGVQGLSRKEVTFYLAVLTASIIITLAVRSWYKRATANDPDQILRRGAGGKESINRLKKACQASLENPDEGVHGVSITAGECPPPYGQATREQVEKVFGPDKLHNTPYPGNLDHKTLELPEEITKAVKDTWNNLWGFK